MDTELKDQIKDADIPEILRSYLLRNKHVGLFLDETLLKEIEEIYVEYDSLFIFDEAEFCSYVITGIKKLDKHDYFYHYLYLASKKCIKRQSKMYHLPTPLLL